MFNVENNPFKLSQFKPVMIDETADIIVVSDMFVDDYVGGAELTTQALIDSSPYKVQKLHSRDVSMDALRQGYEKFWIFGNFTQLKPELIPSITANLKYSILEYDFKYCRARSPEKHLEVHGMPCDCHNQFGGKLISAFFYGATLLWWMSESQKRRYEEHFPFLAERDNFVLSSVFDGKTLSKIADLRKLASTNTDARKKWIVLGSDSWIKGFDEAKQWCEANNVDYEVVWNVPYDDMLKKLSESKGLVYLPKGGDTCPRLVIEAKLLGCQLQLNDLVMHKDEAWFATDNLGDIEDYLLTATRTFWHAIKASIDKRPTISGYTTVKDCIKQQYPFKQCIQSMLEFCDEVCVVDGGSTDGTWDELCIWALREPRLVLQQIKRDWTHPRSAVFDGMQKAAARDLCRKEFCWQMDCDEVVHEDDAKSIAKLTAAIPKEVHVLSLPVIEYWGGVDKVRLDVTPWKWRLTRNDPTITHGIPSALRRHDSEGNLYSAPGSDGCDLIDRETGDSVPHVSFYTADIDAVRRRALEGDLNARHQYEAWFNSVVNELPCVFHYSWYDIARKIRLYRDYWSRHWDVLSGGTGSDTADNNMFFDVPWSDVTDDMIESRAKELSEKTGGWIWHKKWDGTDTPSIHVNRSQPKVML